ncbi:MAG: response regulator [Bacteroidales bacterium]|nr:response regulator [Bacteroidales bacterium]
MIQLKKEMSILLVEDNVLNQKLMYFNMTKMGFNMKTVNNGQEAVDEFKERSYDFVLMDLMMPVMDGYQATQAIRNIEKESGKKSYIIGLTSNVYDSDREKCLDIGMDEFMSKPFDIDNFVKILQNNGYV